MSTRVAPGVGANLLGQHASDRNQDATAYVGNLDAMTTEELLWELFQQAGPVVNVYVPKDRVTGLHQGYGFVEFRSEEDCDYAIKIMNMIKLYGKPIRVNKASQDKKNLDVGANLFIGNLDPDVDEKLLYDTFSAFGVIIQNPKVMRDPDTGNSRGFGFVSYDSFEASDAAIEAMGGQYLCNRPITVSYAYKKDTKGERHGTPAERLLAASNPTLQRNRPHTMFASAPPTAGGGGGPPFEDGGGMPPPHMANGMHHGMDGGPMMPPHGQFPPPPPSMGMPPPPHQNFPPQFPPQGPPMNYGMPPPQQFQPPPGAYPPQFRQPAPWQNQGGPQQPPPQQQQPPPWARPGGGPPPNMPPPPGGFRPPGQAPPPQQFGMPPPPQGFMRPPGPPQGGPPPPPPSR